jgi:signal transduction histidine kinase
VQLMDGRLELQSAPGQGSTFSVTLALALADD